MSETEQIRAAARAVVFKLIGHPVGDDEGLISAGLIDSLAIIRMIAELESRLGKAIPTDSLQPDDFDTIELIVETVKRVTQPAR